MSSRIVPALLVLLGAAGCDFEEPIDPVSKSTFTVPGARTGSLGTGSTACDRCVEERCAPELAACGDSCRTSYAEQVGCLFPDGEIWSGFSSHVCGSTASAPDPAATAILDCASSACADVSACGAEPRAVFTYEAEAVGVDFSAAAFLEQYCNGCHNPGFVPPPGKWVTSFSTDWQWGRPFDDRNWLDHASYGDVLARADIIRCGVFPGELPPGCATLASVASGFFQGAEKFPPKAAERPASYGTSGEPMCPFGIDGAHCPQPSEFERRRMVSWIDGGMVEN